MDKKSIIRFEYNELPTDFIIQVGDCEFHCHKSILIKRSGFLKSMLEQDTHSFIENKTSILKLNDFDVKTIELILIFIYKNADIDFLIDTMIACDYLDIKASENVDFDITSKLLTYINCLDLAITNNNCLKILSKTRTYLNPSSLLYRRTFNYCLDYLYSIYNQEKKQEISLNLNNEYLTSELIKAGKVRMKKCIILFYKYRMLYYNPETKVILKDYNGDFDYSKSISIVFLYDSIYITYWANEENYKLIRFDILSEQLVEDFPSPPESFGWDGTIIGSMNGYLYSLYHKNVEAYRIELIKYCPLERKWIHSYFNLSFRLFERGLPKFLVSDNEQIFIIASKIYRGTLCVSYYDSILEKWTEVYDCPLGYISAIDHCFVAKQKIHFFGPRPLTHSLDINNWIEEGCGNQKFLFRFNSKYFIHLKEPTELFGSLKDTLNVGNNNDKFEALKGDDEIDLLCLHDAIVSLTP